MHAYITRQPLKPYWISRSKVKVTQVMKYDFFLRSVKKMVNFGLLTIKWPWPLTCDLEIQYRSRGCRGTSSRKILSSWSSAAVHELSCPKAFCPISQWWKILQSGPATLTFDLWPWNPLGVSCGCRGTRKLSSSWVQWFTSYRAYREKTSDENNTVRRYRADSNSNTVAHHCGWSVPRDLSRRISDNFNTSFVRPRRAQTSPGWVASTPSTLIRRLDSRHFRRLNTLPL